MSTSVPEESRSDGLLDAIRPYLWPAIAVAGLAIVVCSQVTWGYSDEGVRLHVTGLGGVSADAAASDDVRAFFGQYTRRPGLATLALGVVAMLAGLLGWWRPVRGHRKVAALLGVVGAVAGVAASVLAVRVISDPFGKLFAPNVIDAVGSDVTSFHTGWGVIATLVFGVLATIAGIAAAATTVMGAADSPDLTSSRPDRPRVTRLE